MLRCNLAVLLSERNLRITKVSKDTGISRTTLTALYYNHGQGIQFDTMNQLCTYLSVTPEQLFTFIPFDIEVKVTFEGVSSDDRDDYFDVVFKVNDKSKPLEFHLEGSVIKSVDRNSFIESANIELGLYDECTNVEYYGMNVLIKKYFSLIPITFKSDFEQTITSQVIDELELTNNHNLGKFGIEFAQEESYTIEIKDWSFYWSDELQFKR